jgi:phospholipid/cholesterol/gamma-HCH transport system substrate-binding protein
MGKRGIETLVGLFVLLGLAGLLFLSLQAANLASFGERKGYVVSARFDNIGGLKARAPVRSAGVTVGRVTSIVLDANTYQGLVHMEIDRDVQFPKDSSAKIQTAGLLGDQYVGIEPGIEDQPLGEGGVIRQTQSAVVLENLIGQFLFSRAADAGSPADTPASGAKK